MPDFNLWEADAIRDRATLFGDHLTADGLIDMESWAAEFNGELT